MSFRYTFEFKNSEGSCTFAYNTFIAVITDFEQPCYSICVKPELKTTRYDGHPIYHTTGLSETSFTPLTNLKQALEFFRVKVYQKFTQETQYLPIKKKLEKFGFDISELELDIHSNFLSNDVVREILGEVG